MSKSERMKAMITWLNSVTKGRPEIKFAEASGKYNDIIYKRGVGNTWTVWGMFDSKDCESDWHNLRRHKKLDLVNADSHPENPNWSVGFYVYSK